MRCRNGVVGIPLVWWSDGCGSNLNAASSTLKKKNTLRLNNRLVLNLCNLVSKSKVEAFFVCGSLQKQQQTWRFHSCFYILKGKKKLDYNSIETFIKNAEEVKNDEVTTFMSLDITFLTLSHTIINSMA